MNDSYPTSQPPRSRNPIKHLFFWLSGAGADTLEQCPGWEQRKYVAFGATVLVPTVFAFIACGYALSTLTDNWNIIVPIALAWGLIIMTIDRALLSIYRSYQKFHRKISQFFLRIVVAALMGVTISHPLTLLLFNDTITSVVEGDRQTEIEAVRVAANAEKATVEAKVAGLETQIAEQRASFEKTFSAEFLVEDDSAGLADPLADLDDELREQMTARITADTAVYLTKLDAVNSDFDGMQAKYATLQTELDTWQKEFEREVNGQRSGIVGLGPRAKSIQADQLAWRRDEAKRMSETLAYLTEQRNDLAARIKETEEGIKGEFVGIAAAKAERLKEERVRVADLKRQVQQSQVDQFVDQQNTIRSTITAQIDTRLAELTRLQGEIAAIGVQEQERIADIAAEPRRDILTQTLALHSLFDQNTEGGHFALTAYFILAGLFMLIDTIPLVVKFFSQPGPYDALVDRDEVRYARERQAWLKSYNQYMDGLSDGRLLHLTQNKPLERAVIDGIDSSRAAKAFMENLLDLETAFEERIEQEKSRLTDEKNARSKNREKRLERFAETFYDDLNNRMETFFDHDAARAAARGAA
ncbi:MAG: DUF4407 domain-containing protein [Verrucomicrobiales bacterium]|nr:DUF4407 domain-containing protein [Verrucomicrobiales bacterium]MDP4791336.1 DUF4407 domain-containing protein [Verrucomicrobiales bacterium]MDP5004436.1 DUF4407 domain-containing protein [Verrucomicrobiales bacterium]